MIDNRISLGSAAKNTCDIQITHIRGHTDFDIRTIEALFYLFSFFRFNKTSYDASHVFAILSIDLDRAFAV